MFLQGRLGRICAAILAGVFVSAISASAFTNLSITNFGSSSATPSLSQVTAVGASTAVESTFNGGLLFTNATGSNLYPTSDGVGDIGTSTRRWAFINAASGTNALPSIRVGTKPNGLSTSDDSSVQISASGTSALSLTQNAVIFQSGVTPRPVSNNSIDLGTVNQAFRSIYASTTVRSGGSTNAFLAGDGTAALPAYSFIGDPDTGIYSTGANSVGVSLGGSQELSLSNLVLRPGAASGLDLGSSAVPWLNVYASGTANLDTIVAITSTFSSTSTHNNISNTGLMATNGGVDFYSTTGTEHVAALPVTGTGNLGFLFSAVSDVSSANLFTVREAGTNRLTLNGSGLLTVGSANISTTLTSIGNTSLAAVTSSSATVDFPNIGAPGVTQDLVCWTATLGRLTHQATTCTVSSARFKENIKSMSPAEMLKKVMALRAVSFDWKPGMEPDHGINGGGKESNGFIAEEVALIDPMLVVYTDEYTPEDLAFVTKNYTDAILKKDGKTLIPKTVDYARVSVYTTGAIQAQQAQIDELRSLTRGVESNKRSFYERLIQFFSGIFN